MKYFSPAEPGGFDLSAGNAFKITFDAAPTSGGFVDMGLTADASSSNIITDSLRHPITGAGALLILFSSFDQSDNESSLFEDIDFIQIDIDGTATPNATYRIASIEVVSEPSASLQIGTALAGLLGLAFIRRWSWGRKSARA
ncbi:MAG: hypothetical protein ACE5FG_05475 [Myxococcota bacterium]